MRLAVPALLALSTLVVATPLAATDADDVRKWIFVGEDTGGPIVVRDLTDAELQHENNPVDEKCGGLAPAQFTCGAGPFGPFWGLGHGFMLPDCVDDTVHDPCYVGTLESKLVGADGATRILRWNRAVTGPISIVTLVTTSSGAWPFDQEVTQGCTSYAFTPGQNAVDPVVPGGAGQWLCFMNHWPH